MEKKFRWVESEDLGKHYFTFDGEKIYNLFEDYPHNLTADEIELFDKENPFWVFFFKNKKNKN